MSLSDSFLKTFHNVVEERFAIRFELSEQKELNASGMFKEITFGFDFVMADINQRVYYFMDKKFTRNLFTAMINEVDNPQMDSELTSKVIGLFNEKVLNKLNKDFNVNCSMRNSGLVKDIATEFLGERDNLSIAYLSSQKGGIFIGFVIKTGFNMEQVNPTPNLEHSKKLSGGLIQNTSKSKKDEPGLIYENSLRSAVQLLEIKKQVLTSLGEIKDLKGDPDFLLRKAKTVSELGRLWFDISKEEN